MRAGPKEISLLHSIPYNLINSIDQHELLPRDFYLNDSTVRIARKLLGKLLISTTGEVITGGLIVETEAYCGINDRACHAYMGKKTKRNSALYMEGGTVYVYFTYGLHYLLNVVTRPAGIPEAVLIRGIIPAVGIKEIYRRRNRDMPLEDICIGPATVTQALMIDLRQNGTSFLEGPLKIYETGLSFSSKEIMVGPRVGVDYAGEDAFLPYRFQVTKQARQKLINKFLNAINHEREEENTR